MFSPLEETITEVRWNGEEEAEIVCGSTHWSGAKRRDFFTPDVNWEDRIGAGSLIRMWTLQWSRVFGFELWNPANQKWDIVWALGNDFGYKEERDRRALAYDNAASSARDKIALALNAGDDLETLLEAVLSMGLSGNQMDWALNAAAWQCARGPDLKDLLHGKYPRVYQNGDRIRAERTKATKPTEGTNETVK